MVRVEVCLIGLGRRGGAEGASRLCFEWRMTTMAWALPVALATNLASNLADAPDEGGRGKVLKRTWWAATASDRAFTSAAEAAESVSPYLRGVDRGMAARFRGATKAIVAAARRCPRGTRTLEEAAPLFREFAKLCVTEDSPVALLVWLMDTFGKLARQACAAAFGEPFSPYVVMSVGRAGSRSRSPLVLVGPPAACKSLTTHQEALAVVASLLRRT
jgi:hypothetical protein